MLEYCTIDNCTNELKTKTLCDKHWYQIHTFGKAITTRYDDREAIDKGEYLQIPLWGMTGVVAYAKVNSEFDYLADLKWCLSDTGYARSLQQGTWIKMHRVVMDAHKGMIIDHINMDKLDNRRLNLRFCDVSQNNANRVKQSNNTTGYKGVYKRGKRWCAKAVKAGIQYHFGTYDTPEQAAEAYDAGAVRLFGEYAKLNLSEIGG